MKKLNIYLAGPLFTQAEIDQRNYEAKELRKFGYEVYSPIEQNADIGYDIDELYRRDIIAMTKADISVLCLDNFDSGTMAELGWFVANSKPVFSHWTNWKYDEPDNLFIRGMALEGPNKLFNKLDLLLEHLAIYNK